MKITKEIIERIEGEASIELEWENERVAFSRMKFLNYRGMEQILENRPVLDALALTPRVCGICSHSHVIASVHALESLYENNNETLTITQKAKSIREIALNAEKIHNHLKWYFFTILPELHKIQHPDYQGNLFKEKAWFDAQRAIAESLKMAAYFTGQWPHGSFVMPGGVTCDPTNHDVIASLASLSSVIAYCEEAIFGTTLDEFLSFDSALQLMASPCALSKGIDQMIALGFDHSGRSLDRFLALGESFFYEGSLKAYKTTVLHANVRFVHESLEHTFFESPTQGFTYAKSALYKRAFHEVGPMARLMIAKDPLIRDFHRRFKDSALTRVVARMSECAHLLRRTHVLLSSLNIKEPSYIMPKQNVYHLSGEGIGVVEAPRGTLIHHIKAHNGIIKSYDIITPTVWNLGNGERENPSVIQKALIGIDSFTKVDFIVKSFDVCSVCTTQ